MPLFNLSLGQLFLAFISAALLQRHSIHRFFLRWLLSHKLICYLTPTDDDLRRLRGRYKYDSPPKSSAPKAAKGGRKGGQKQQPKQKQTTSTPSPRSESRAETPDEHGTFKVHCSELGLLKMKQKVMTMEDMDQIMYTDDLEWLAGLSFMSMFSYIFTELQFYLQPQTREYNFSLVWGLVVIFYCLKILFSLTLGYFFSGSTGERSVCLLAFCVYLLISMVFLFEREDKWEFGLEDSYKAFCESASSIMARGADLVTTTTTQATFIGDKKVFKPVDLMVIKFVLSILSGYIGMILIFPGLRYGQMHRELMSKAGPSLIKRLLYAFNYKSSIFIVFLWYKPLARNLLTKQTLFPLDDASFDTLRLYLIIFIALVRFVQLPNYLSAYLLCATRKVEALRARGGTVTNKEIQLGVSSMVTYVNVVSMQYIIPLLMVIFHAMIIISICGYSWVPPAFADYFPRSMSQVGTYVNITDSPIEDTKKTETSLQNNQYSTMSPATSTTEIPPPVDETTKALADGFKSIYNEIASMVSFIRLEDAEHMSRPAIFKGLFNYSTFWIHFVWFTTTSLGLIYNTYLVN